MSEEQKKKTDYTFILSMVAIVILAVYFFISRMDEFNLSAYLQQTGEGLLAQMTDTAGKKELQEDYERLIKRIENKDIDPRKVEYLAANLINLKQAGEKLDEATVRVVFDNALKVIEESDSIIISVGNEEKWMALNTRMKYIYNLEKELKSPEFTDKASGNSGTFSYAVDDSLKIIIDDRLKGDLLNSQSTKIKIELQKLQEEKLLQWSKDFEKKKTAKNTEIQNRIKVIHKNLENKKSQISIELSEAHADAIIAAENDSNKTYIFNYSFSDSPMVAPIILPPPPPKEVQTRKPLK